MKKINQGNEKMNRLNENDHYIYWPIFLLHGTTSNY